mgnify:FL=1
MVKEGIIFFIILIAAGLAIEAVNAEIYIEGLDNEKYNLGEIVLIEGYVQQQSKFSGTLEINSICGNESNAIFFSLVSLDANEKHSFSQEFPVTKVVEGSCYLLVSVKGGEISEERKSIEFYVTNELRVDGDLDVLTQKPGRDVIVSGVIRKANGLRVESGSVALTIDGKVYGVGLSDGAFNYRITLDNSIDSGDQIISIKARDLDGNEGNGEIRFRVISVPEEVKINLDKDVYRPGESLVATVFLNDQSGDNVIGSSAVQLVDPNNKDALTKIVDNGNEFEIFLDELTVPGTWIIRAESKGFQSSKKFYVEEIKDKEIKLLEENKLSIRNIGNVDYNEPVEIVLKKENGEEFKVVKKTSLKPNQTIFLDLNDEVPSGSYDVSVGGNLITGNVILDGSGIENLKHNSIAGYFALIFVFLFLIFVVITQGRKRFSRRNVAREKGREILIRRRDSNRDPSRTNEMRTRERKEVHGSFVKATKEDVDHMLDKIKKEVPVDSGKKSDRGNPFNIFD